MRTRWNAWSVYGLHEVSTLRQQIGDADALGQGSKGRDRGIGIERFDRSVAPAPADRAVSRRLAVDFEDALHEVDDPVIGDLRATRSGSASERISLRRTLAPAPSQPEAPPSC